MESIIYLFGGALFYFLLDLLKAYYKTKIESKVTQKNLPLVTAITEEIKQEFRKDISNVNAQLSILTNQSSIIDEKSIQVLNNFFERCLKIKDLHSQNFGDFSGKNYIDNLANYQSDVLDTHMKLYSDYHNLVLFHTKNTDILNNVYRLIEINTLLRSTFKSHFGEIKRALVYEIRNWTDSEYLENVEKSSKLIEDYYNDQNSNLETFDKYFFELLKSLSKYFSEYGLHYNYEELRK